MKAFVLLLAIPANFVSVTAFQDTKPCNPCELRVAQSVARKLQLSRVEPVYPPEARASGISSSVRIGYVISKQGSVVRTFCVKAETGQSPFEKQICRAAREAVAQWKYRPYVISGEPVEVESAVVLTYDFSETASSDTASNIPGKPGKLRITPAMAEGNLIRRIEPTYPADAKKNGIWGDVILKVLIYHDGHVAVLEQVSGDPGLGRAAADAVEQWVYTPYMLNGDYVDVETTVTVNFRL